MLTKPIFSVEASEFCDEFLQHSDTPLDFSLPWRKRESNGVPSVIAYMTKIYAFLLWLVQRSFQKKKN